MNAALHYRSSGSKNKTTKQQQQQQQQQQQEMWSENHSGCAQEFGIRGQTNYLNFIS